MAPTAAQRSATARRNAARHQEHDNTPEVPETPAETNHVNGNGINPGRQTPDTDPGQLDGLGYSAEYLARLGLSEAALRQLQETADETVSRGRGGLADTNESAQKVRKELRKAIEGYLALAESTDESEDIPDYDPTRHLFLGPNNVFTALSLAVKKWLDSQNKRLSPFGVVASISWGAHTATPNKRSTAADDSKKVVYMVGTLSIEVDEQETPAGQPAA